MSDSCIVSGPLLLSKRQIAVAPNKQNFLGVVVGDTFHGQHFRPYIFYLLFLVEIKTFVQGPKLYP